MSKIRRLHTAAFKFRVALGALEGSKTMSQMSSEQARKCGLMDIALFRVLSDAGLRISEAAAPVFRVCALGCGLFMSGARAYLQDTRLM